MPQVPLYSRGNVPLVQPDTSPLRGQQISVNQNMFGADVAQASVQAGKNLENVGEQLFKRAIEVQELNNQTAARDASNKFIEEMGQADLQYRQLEGKAAIDGYQAHVENIKKIHEKYSGSMGNDSARRYFLNDSSRQLTYNIINSSHWAAGQGKKYRSEVNDASVRIAQNNAAVQTDDMNFQNSIISIDGAVNSEAANSNWSPERRQVVKDEKISGAWASRLGTIALTDPVRAKTLFDKNKDQIRDAVQRQSIERTIHQSMMTKATDQLANEVVDGVSTPATVQGREAKMLQHATRKYGAVAAAGMVGNAYVESAGTYDPAIQGDSKTSIGIYQHHGPRKDELFKWAVEHGRNPRDLQTQMEFADYELENNPRFAGVAEALRAAKTPEEAAKIWHDRFEVPQPGSLGMRQARARELAGKKYEPIGLTPNTTPGQLSEMLQVAEQRANAVMPGNEDFIEATKSKVRTKYEGVKKVANDIKNVYYQGFMASLVDDKVTTMDQLFKGDPNKQQAYWQLTPEQHRSIQGAMEKNAKGRDSNWSAAKLSRENELYGMADRDPESFKRLVLANEELPPEAIRKLQATQRELITPSTAAKEAKSAMYTNAWGHIKHKVEPLGVSRELKQNDPRAERSDQFLGAFYKEVDSFYKENKRPPSAVEAGDIAANLIKVEKPVGWKGYIPFGPRDQMVFEQKATSATGPVQSAEGTLPDTFKARYRDSYKAANEGREPSDEHMRVQYLKAIESGRKWTEQGWTK